MDGARYLEDGKLTIFRRSGVLEGGGGELPIEGQPTRMIKAGEAFQIPPETPHAGGKPGDTNGDEEGRAVEPNRANAWFS